MRWNDDEPYGMYRQDTPLVECLKRKEYTLKIKTLIDGNKCYVTYLKQLHRREHCARVSEGDEAAGRGAQQHQHRRRLHSAERRRGKVLQPASCCHRQ